ncbi:histidine phosphatase family protein [Sediminivirga luteola]|uniref:histidine phosphatase family protein n=1 Tax=Sediminivirga luteola TaxID=1774748 RepID=UPI001F58114B|nr:histidine phosphatase family protein [Sediminivirga luteola]MCI2263915.1 histidine phosphatase family protein [Sediminivirga luteola]
MPILHLVRHGQSTSNAAGTLAGRTPGVGLTAQGEQETRALAEFVRGLDPALIAVSPLQRCQETARLLAGTLGWHGERMRTVSGLQEVDYGRWAGASLKSLAAEPAWQELRADPAAFAFPGGETVAQMAARARAAVEDQDAQVRRSSGEKAVWVAVSHGDIIQAVLAWALGMPLSCYRRIAVPPASVSTVHLGPEPLVTLVGARPGFGPPARSGEPARIGGA